MSESPTFASLRQSVIERLTAIKLHANALQRRLRRQEPLDPAATARQLAAISAEVDAAAQLVRHLTEDGGVAAGVPPP